MPLFEEDFLPIKNFEKYKISNMGRVYSGHSFKMLKQVDNHSGYLLVTLYNGKVYYTTHYVHRLVLSTFGRPPKEGEEVNHINGNKNDNRFVNLEWCTRQENILHAVEYGLRKNKLSEIDVQEIKTIYDMGGYFQWQIAEMYNVSQGHISKILSRRRRQYVTVI